MVVSTPLKNISQLGVFFPIYGKIKHVPNHQPVLICMHYILSTGTSIKPPSTSKKLGPWVHCLFMSCFYSVYFHISLWFPHVSTTSHRSTSNAFLADFLAHQSLNLYVYTLWYIGQTHGKFHVLEATDWGTSSIN